MASKEVGDVDMLKCGVCLERYNRPKLLPCFHTYCQRCVEKLAGTKPSFSCPACRAVVVIPPGGAANLQANFYIEKDLAKQEAHEGRECQLCSKGKQAKFKCVQCHQAYCAPCRGTHDSIESCTQHTILPLDGDGRAAGKLGEEAGAANEKKCPKHKNQLLLLFCRPCQTSICMQCKLTSHDGHDTEDVVDTGARARGELQEESNTLAQREQLLKAVLSKVDDFYGDLEKEKLSVEQAIRDRSKQLQAIVAQAEEEALHTVQTTAESAVNDLTEQAKPIKERHATVTAKRRHIEQVVNEGEDGEAVSMLAKLRSEAELSSKDKSSHGQASMTVERSTVSHGFRARAVRYNDVLAFIGTAREGPLLETKALSVDASSLQESVKPRPAQPFASQFANAKYSLSKKGVLQTTEIIYSKNPKATLDQMCLTAGDSVWLVFNPGGDVKLMALFDDEGRRLETLYHGFPTPPLITCDGDAILSLTDGKWVRPGGEKGQLEDLTARSGALLSKSSPPLLYLSCNIYRINSLATLPPEIEEDPAYYVAYNATTFDASRDGKFFVLLYTDTVYIFDTNETTTELRRYASYSHPDETSPYPSDACFTIVDGEELLLVAFADMNTVHLVDHKDGCCFVRTLETDERPLERPFRLATDNQGRVWVGCHGGKVVIFDL
ncbi:hypothetical protein BaRGS_00036011 [Batillaria attramentaria]|uniref:Uncharacterized protein n=1 Tax=Batillaria attramentaria TaxID=370345 RepID=A0ABD0JD61_9CAEN